MPCKTFFQNPNTRLDQARILACNRFLWELQGWTAGADLGGGGGGGGGGGPGGPDPPFLYEEWRNA